MRVPPTQPPPPPPHTHTQTLGKHVRLSAPGFDAHRICACADPDFHFFRPLISQRGHMLSSLTSFFFFPTENYRPSINRPVRGPRMTRKSLL